MTRFAVLAVALLASPALAQDFAPNRLLVVGRDSLSLIQLSEAGAQVAETDLGGAGHRFGAAVAPDGRLYVANWDIDRVEVFAPSGAKQGEIGAGTLIDAPAFVAIGPNGNVYVSATTLQSVLEYTPSGSFVRFIGIVSGLTQPTGLAFGPDGHLFVTSNDQDRVYEFDADGGTVRKIDVGAALDDPYGVAFGPDGNLYVASFSTDRIVRITPVGAAGTLVNEIGAGTALAGPIDVVIGPNGNVFTTSFARNSVFEFTTGGTFVAEHPVSSTATAVPRPTGLVVAPFRFKAKLTGTVARKGAAVHTIKDKGAVLSVSPGSCCAMLSLANDPASSVDLTDEFETSSIVLRGWETAKDPLATKRWIQGAHVPNEAAWNPVGSVALQLTGKLGLAGAFVPKSVSGTMHFAASGVIASAKITTAGLVK
ncbi:MAG TPA: NHL repeat-containing protein [Planctomycetota bacterium]|nr:NHL repeat-containing protein [Planctomycetota bacterium]